MVQCVVLAPTNGITRAASASDADDGDAARVQVAQGLINESVLWTPSSLAWWLLTEHYRST